ncbi:MULTISPECIES: hypothetical protein [Marinomonas]|uniref:Uncharacterized protein n=1 Tax=Marinomonas arctica TaxID=383750 RepID=A0A7H1J2V7_9GAMM|nr:MULTISPECIES: hypothetical protein [Marinomonas]MCS7486535.1 hypothetical protein [Marinomonas sp. BSi20414]QNT04823.1 hypothetical protein IBG28_14045 [Marinomonas arctica]GGN31108.1 hypothetical protein GCM10011350_24470 [Marinomonas arctica]
MLDAPFLPKEPYQNADIRILCDIFSMCFDGFFANSALCGRVGNTLDKHVFKKVSSLYRRLAERLLLNVGALPEDTGTMNPEPGYVATAYLSALNAPDRYAPSRIMLVNWQVIKRIGKLVRKLENKIFANTIVDYLAYIQIVLDNTEHRRKTAKLLG